MLTETCSHQLMMDVVLIGLEDRHTVTDAHQRHAYHIIDRHDEQRIGQHHSIGHKIGHPGIVHRQFHKQEAQNETQRQRP